MQDDTTRPTTPQLCECGCGEPLKSPKSRFLQGHNSKYPDQTPEQRFWKYVIPGAFTDCWEWQGALRNGYGVLNINHKVTYCHRFSYELHFGPLPEGYHACHSCDNRKCCNPYHIFAGTQGDNVRDMYAKNRGGKAGTKNRFHPKLTAVQVSEVRRLAAQGMRYPAIAKQFGLSIAGVSLIVTRKRWKELE